MLIISPVFCTGKSQKLIQYELEIRYYSESYRQLWCNKPVHVFGLYVLQLLTISHYTCTLNITKIVVSRLSDQLNCFSSKIPVCYITLAASWPELSKSLITVDVFSLKFGIDFCNLLTEFSWPIWQIFTTDISHFTCPHTNRLPA